MERKNSFVAERQTYRVWVSLLTRKRHCARGTNSGSRTQDIAPHTLVIGLYQRFDLFFAAAFEAEAFPLLVPPAEDARDPLVRALTAVCVLPARTVDARPLRVMRPRDALARARPVGARCIGSATVNVRPGAIELDDRWFHCRRSSTETLNRSETVISESPRITR